MTTCAAAVAMIRFGCGAAGVLVIAVVAAPAAAQPAAAPTNDDCQVCHADASTTRSNGRPVVVPPEKFAASSHAALACVDCHTDLAAVREFPHLETLARVQCLSCHEEAATAYGRGTHAQARRADPASTAATCADCHTAHEIRPASDPASSIYKLNLVATCSRCHGDPAVIQRGGISAGDVSAPFQDSIHGRALAKSGLIVAPACSDCHGSHDIRLESDPASRVHRQTVAATCGSCHAGIRPEYEGSIHARALRGGAAEAPTCADCHSAHQIRRVETEAWKLDVIQECGTCHAPLMEPYRRTFHGKVTELGFTRVATCADCHGAHGILPASDVRSTVGPARLVATCARCHAGANPSFVKYDPHPNPYDYERNRVLWWVNRGYTWLISGLFVFFGLHTLLWFPRSYQALRERRAQKPPAPPAVDDGPAAADGEDAL